MICEDGGLADRLPISETVDKGQRVLKPIPIQAGEF